MKVTLAAALLVAAACGPATAARTAVDPTVRRSVVIGHSVDGRPIVAVELGDPDSASTLVVGCIHGDERAGVSVAERLVASPIPAGEHLWVVTLLNPDGAAAGTRGNGHGVDLNRNFGWRWTRLSGVYDSGPRPLSEPETRAAVRLIRRIKPAISIWFHQHLDAVDTSVGNHGIERRFARAAHLPLAYLAPEPGSAVTWETHRYTQATSFVVELPAGSPSRAAVNRYVRAVHVVAG